MKLETFMHWYWTFFLVVGFAVPEFLMIGLQRYEGTLSDTVWKWCDVLPGQTVWEWKFVHFVLAAFMLWLTLHLVFRLFS